MKYISTRGLSPAQNFEQVLLTGLAPDGGLYVPESLPQFSAEEIAGWKDLSYTELALKIVSPFIDGEIPDSVLRNIIEDAYADFDHVDVAPLKALGSNEWVLELFHGPTLAFKDFALQVLGRLLDYVLKKNNQKVVILGATSGDTGSAALEGCRQSENVELFILHPHQRVSDVQRKQMTTIIADNVHNLAIKGNFDDCQRIVKAGFADQSFLPDGRQLVAVNSINWARILMQIVYYFSASLRLGGPEKQVSFSVPTGNFGDIYAGYLAKKMGLPIDQLIVATNTNDILHRFIANNDYSTTDLSQTFSPSMDILVSSNFERYLFDLFSRDAKTLTSFMQNFGKASISVSDEHWTNVKFEFSSARVDDELTCETIADVFSQYDELLDPHSAIGVKAGRLCRKSATEQMVALATAHPAKFSDAILKAGLDTPALPEHLRDLFDRDEKYSVLENDLSEVTAYISSHCATGD